MTFFPYRAMKQYWKSEASSGKGNDPAKCSGGLEGSGGTRIINSTINSTFMFTHFPSERGESSSRSSRLQLGC